MTIKTITTKTGKTISVEMVREVQDKVSYADGYNIVTGREIIEFTNIVIRNNVGKILMDGKKITYPASIPAEMRSQGAVACIGNAYITQEIVSLVLSALEELDADNPKSDEQVSIEKAAEQAAKEYAAWVNSPEQIAYRAFEREMNNPNSDY